MNKTKIIFKLAFLTMCISNVLNNFGMNFTIPKNFQQPSSPQHIHSALGMRSNVKKIADTLEITEKFANSLIDFVINPNQNLEFTTTPPEITKTGWFTITKEATLNNKPNVRIRIYEATHPGHKKMFPKKSVQKMKFTCRRRVTTHDGFIANLLEHIVTTHCEIKNIIEKETKTNVEFLKGKNCSNCLEFFHGYEKYKSHERTCSLNKQNFGEKTDEEKIKLLQNLKRNFFGGYSPGPRYTNNNWFFYEDLSQRTTNRVQDHFSQL